MKKNKQTNKQTNYFFFPVMFKKSETNYHCSKLDSDGKEFG
jgi:hypothetical protein